MKYLMVMIFTGIAFAGAGVGNVVAQSAAEREALFYMVEEEKVARDVYTLLGERWDVQSFFNIARAEQQHMERVLYLLDGYGLAAPVTINQPGVFENPELQTLYNELTARGSESLIAALETGALIEDVDLADLHRELQVVEDEDIRIVFTNLIRGSENHMRSFVRQLERRGETYTPQHIDADYFQRIVGTDS